MTRLWLHDKDGNRAHVKTCVDPLDGSVSFKKNNYRTIGNIFLCLFVWYSKSLFFKLRSG